MDTFGSLFDEASRDIEAESRDRIVTSATQAATSQCWGFLSLAQSENEFGHRLALVEDRLSAIASEHGLSYEEVAAPLRNGFTAVLAAKEAGDTKSENCSRDAHEECSGRGGCGCSCHSSKEAGLGPKAPDLTSEASGARCANCGHMNPNHRNGGECACGCDSYQPETKTAAIRTYDEDQGARFQCPDCRGVGMSYDLGLTGNTPGIKHCDTCKDSGTVYRFRKADSDGGYSLKDFDFRAAPKHSAKTAVDHTPWQTAHNGNPAMRKGSDGLYYNHNGDPYSEECSNGEGIGCDGGGCSCNCHSDFAPNFQTNADVAKWHREGARKTAGAWDNVADGPLTEKATPDQKESDPSSGSHMPGVPKLPGMGGGAAGGEAGAAAGAGEGAAAAGGLSELAPLLLLAGRHFDDRLALMRTALEEGQDPLAWIPQSAASPAYAEKPGGHMTTQVFEGTETSAYDEALAQGGGSAQPENAGGHSTAPVTRQAARGDSCYHPRSCPRCDSKGEACGAHHVGESGHDRCTGSGGKKATREPNPFS